MGKLDADHCIGDTDSSEGNGVSRNLMMCMHILETLNSIVYLAQS